MSGGYSTVFALADVHYPVEGVLFGLAFVAIGAGIAAFPRLGRGSRLYNRIFGCVFLAFSAFWTIAIFAGTYPGYRRLTEAVARGTTRSKDGCTTSGRCRIRDTRWSPSAWAIRASSIPTS